MLQSKLRLAESICQKYPEIIYIMHHSFPSLRVTKKGNMDSEIKIKTEEINLEVWNPDDEEENISDNDEDRNHVNSGLIYQEEQQHNMSATSTERRRSGRWRSKRSSRKIRGRGKRWISRRDQCRPRMRDP